MTLLKNRRTRRDRCKEYLRRAGSLPAAMETASKEGFAQNTSVWLGALGDVLAEDAKKATPAAR